MRDHIDTIISHIVSPYPISISWMTISIWHITISISPIPYLYPISHINIPIDISLLSDLPYRDPISISDIDIGSSWHSACDVACEDVSARLSDSALNAHGR